MTRKGKLSFWSTFALLSISHVLSVANASAKNLPKVIVILERSEESPESVNLSSFEILRQELKFLPRG